MRIVRRVALLFVAAALTASLALPAVAIAKSGAPAWACAPGDVGSAGRGPVTDAQGRVREKDTGQVAKELPAMAQAMALGTFSVTVPVYFHIITDGATGTVTDDQVAAQISVLNEGFGGDEGGDDTGFSFELAAITRTDNAAWFAISTFAAETAMKQDLKAGGDNALNVYSTSGAGFLGWAYYPEIVTTSQAYLDGVVIHWETIPGVSGTFEGAYDLGKTLTHEAGHWLNLAHTFEGKCSTRGDFVNDTPAQKTPTGGCPEGKDTCKKPGLDPIHNYMDYSYDGCYEEFTPGQTQRAQIAWLLYREP